MCVRGARISINTTLYIVGLVTSLGVCVQIDLRPCRGSVSRRWFDRALAAEQTDQSLHCTGTCSQRQEDTWTVIH